MLQADLQKGVLSTTLITTALMATGCALTAAQQPDQDAVEQRDVVVDFVIDTTEVLDIGGWKANHGAARAQACTLDNVDEGAAYQFTLWAEPGTDHQAAAPRIVEYWESLGMDTRVVDHGGYPAVEATGGHVHGVSFATNTAEDHYEIGAVAHCAPDDARELKEEYNEGRKNGERFPGDEYVPEENISDKYK